MDYSRQTLSNIAIVILAMVVIYFLFRPIVDEDKPQPVDAQVIVSKAQSQEDIEDHAHPEEPPMVDEFPEQETDEMIDAFGPIPNGAHKCACGCMNCSCNPATCRCGQIMNASDQYAVPIQGKGQRYDCGCGCSQKDKPCLSVSNPEFLNEWANFRSNSYQNSSNISPDTVDLIQQMYVEDNNMPSRKYKGKTIAEVFDKLTDKNEFMRCVHLPDMEDQPMVGVNPYDPKEINF